MPYNLSCEREESSTSCRCGFPERYEIPSFFCYTRVLLYLLRGPPGGTTFIDARYFTKKEKWVDEGVRTSPYGTTLTNKVHYD